MVLGMVHTRTSATEQPPLERPVWSQSIGGPLNLAPIVGDGRVFVIPQGGRLQALDAGTGELLWQRNSADVWDRGLTLVGQLLIACLTSGEVTALDSSNGQERWRQSLQGSHCQRPVTHANAHLLVSTTFVGPGIQPQPDLRAKLFDFDLFTGQMRWAFESETYLLQTAVIHADRVYVGGAFLDPTYEAEEGGSAYYYALNLSNGQRLWRHLSRDGLPKTLAATSQTMAYVGYEDFVQGLDARDGRLRWTRDTENWVSGMTQSGNVLYLGSANRAIHAWNIETGETQWRFNMPGASFDYLLVRPVVHGPVLWFMTQTGRLFALSKHTGQPLWTAHTQHVSRIDAAFAQGLAFVGDIDGRLTAFRLPAKLWETEALQGR